MRISKCHRNWTLISPFKQWGNFYFVQSKIQNSKHLQPHTLYTDDITNQKICKNRKNWTHTFKNDGITILENIPITLVIVFSLVSLIFVFTGNFISHIVFSRSWRIYPLNMSQTPRLECPKSKKYTGLNLSLCFLKIIVINIIYLLIFLENL